MPDAVYQFSGILPVLRPRSCVRIPLVNKSRPFFLIFLSLLLFVSLGFSETSRALIELEERDRPVLKDSPWGQYWRFAPLGKISNILVVVHGTVEENQKAADLAGQFINRWMEYARSEHLLVLSPAFDKLDYQGPYGGYRGLFGRKCGADEFVNNLVDLYRSCVKNDSGRFLLYGHSAGGQFAGRYLVRHPNRLGAVVLSAPGRYAFPDPNVPWPYGMGRIKRTMKWSKMDIHQIDIQPDPEGWLKAACVPVSVVVGEKDLEPQPARPGQKGKNRVEIASHWIKDMRDLARKNGKSPNLRSVIVHGAGHSSTALTPACQKEMSSIMKKDKKTPGKSDPAP